MKPVIALAAALLATAVQASPEQDISEFQAYYEKRFPAFSLNEYVDGAYILPVYADGRAQWEEVEEFPPYEANVEAGETLWNQSFANGKMYADCFTAPLEKIRASHPYFDEATQQVVTLEYALNNCRKENGEKPLKWKKGPIADLSAFLAWQSRGQKIDVKIESEGARKAYEEGKQFFYAKRGQLNMSCADCHVYNAGNKARSEVLSPALGHVSHWPVYRAKWSELGTLHRRYGGCNKNIRATPQKAQSEAYRNLEFFHNAMSNGLEFNGPGYRK